MTNMIEAEAIDEAVIDRLKQEEIEAIHELFSTASVAGYNWAETAQYEEIAEIAVMDVTSYVDPLEGLLGLLGMNERYEFLNATGSLSSFHLENFPDAIAEGFVDGVRNFVSVAQKQGAFKHIVLRD
jgi:hypothetical protein